MQNNEDTNLLVLSTDAKPRLKWTPQLHLRFVQALDHLGGPQKATPKSLMRMMGITGLTLYHLKSHLQKYRLGNNDSINLLQDSKNIIQTNDGHLNGENSDIGSQMDHQNLSISKAALELQLELQKKLHEQIEVQRHLQLRIEAQGKYLESVLRKAEEAIAGYGCSSLSELTDTGELSSLTSNSGLSRRRRRRSAASCSISNGDCAEFVSEKRSCRGQRDQSDEDFAYSSGMIDLNSTQFDHHNDAAIDSDAALVQVQLNSKGMIDQPQMIEYL